MPLLARLAAHTGGPQEKTGTDALGLVLEDPDAARAFTAALRTGFPELPEEIRFVTQRGSEGTRPDVLGLHHDREVLVVEGKFWAGLTEAQADGGYLRRLEREHRLRDPGHRCPGVLLWVCPPRRATQLWREVLRLSGAQEMPAADAVTWRFARTGAGQGVALVSWPALCATLEPAGGRELAEDVRQLKHFVDAVDRNAFVPWTVEQITDQETPRRQHELYRLTADVRERAQRRGVLDRAGKNAPSRAGSAVGCVVHLGGHWTAFQVSPALQAEYGVSPWWLRWWRGAGVAREALRRHGLVELRDGCAVPVPLRAGATRDQVIEETVEWFAGLAPLLRAARAERARRGAAVADDEDAETDRAGD
ncbi:hypothetical protein [Actinoplanes teichomyceticus]|uniref:PD-(D/E)XK nuclease superfamily protein n=1 Tax=Actinoplanes teichomyceticus TaxID=1867 RepID=A0A561VCL6_ACTTI|nr:hypothetical protein [Actinoplanes teichomyceticus]TWG09337.1 hypothetical protein FHX34_10852 [Actinoplanes teichomyceticus]GIF16639.1 hypothetical protein Ate01nite_66710 [Actinoplanes teichomyceticus]